MQVINRITVHHEGWTTFWQTDEPSTAARLEKIRTVHTRDRKWGDIGYHYIIDRLGRIWEGRDLRYQGAHVRGRNEHNLGVMVLGNFDRQVPTSAQLRKLASALRTLIRQYHVPLHRVHTHQELTPTACPGKHLQPQVAILRRNGGLV